MASCLVSDLLVSATPLGMGSGTGLLHGRGVAGSCSLGLQRTSKGQSLHLLEQEDGGGYLLLFV